MDRVLVIESKVSNLRKVEDFLEEFSYEANLSREAYAKVLVSVMEAVNNAIVHGNHGDRKKKVHVHFVEGTSMLIVTVTDEGKGFAPDTVPDPTKPENIENASGRGVFLMRRLADEIEFNSRGNSVKMKFKLVSD
jgi:serine/threonine-protein kinase RsbW